LCCWRAGSRRLGGQRRSDDLWRINVP
jgi:hypothetical protein